jgi:hypothetical protein
MILIFIPWKSNRIELVDPLTRQRAYPPLGIGALRVRPLFYCLVFDIILGNRPVPTSDETRLPFGNVCPKQLPSCLLYSAKTCPYWKADLRLPPFLATERSTSEA